jgi:hypothetical protein
MSRFLIWLSGANASLLAQHPTWRTRLAALGGVVLTTAVLAGLSLAFALRMALELPPPLCIAGGLMWGLAILNLAQRQEASADRPGAISLSDF